MEQKEIEYLQDYECTIENVLTQLHELKSGNPSDVLLGYLMQHLVAAQALLKTLLETETKK